MGCRQLSMIVLFLWVFQFPDKTVVSSAVEEKGTVFVYGRAAVGTVDEDFICATLDWWPPQKCDYGTCAWDHASILNLDLNNTIFQNAIREFAPLKIRIGGTLQDLVIYETPDQKQPCLPFTQNTSLLFGYTQGCLPMRRWNQLNDFFSKTGAKVIFGLNALSGRSIQSNGEAVGAWDYTNAESFIRYIVQNNHTVDGWELGNELCGSGVGTRVAASQYATDTIALRNIVNRVYKDGSPMPLVIGPGGFFDAAWFTEYLNKAENSLNATTRHIYNLGPGKVLIMQKGITVLLMNLDNTTTVVANVELNNTYKLRHRKTSQKIARTSQMPWVSDGETQREEYHLTAKDGNLHSQTMLLNGHALQVNSIGDIPPLEPIHVNSTDPITIAPYSIVFVHMPNVVVPACA
ncbi:hypothetical protein DY000_02053407 [Brassica cretica]|uniref:Heparanase-like protein 3 n=1 Tax=Brassica cretica TaxID=69181 RepID=A0ABQ7AJT0_BRACR|nr:hypothetical protein DY000_02053407 [Brassica cretica]